MSNNQTQGASVEAEREFEAWWEKHGQYIRAGGGDYEKCFAYGAWNARRTPDPAGAGELPPLPEPGIDVFRIKGFKAEQMQAYARAAIAADRAQRAAASASAQPDRGAAQPVAQVVEQSADAAFQQCGWMYISDDGYGPFHCESERNAKRYLHHWPVFKRAPADGHVCDYKLAYGCCSQCEAIDAAMSVQQGQKGGAA